MSGDSSSDSGQSDSGHNTCPDAIASYSNAMGHLSTITGQAVDGYFDGHQNSVTVGQVTEAAIDAYGANNAMHVACNANNE